MRKFVTLFFLILLMTTTCFSQNILVRENSDTIVLITPKQLKETNLIFAEHQKLLKENSLLFKQISNYKLDNSLLLRTDSLKTLQIKDYENLVTAYSLNIEKLNKEIKKQDKTILTLKISGITVGVGLLVWLLLK